MKKLLLAGSVVAVLGIVLALSESRIAATLRPAEEGGLQIESGKKNPWTGLKLNADDDQFQFAVVSDRTGGHREKVFSQAVLRVNLLQPEFVMSVGDLIEGYSTKDDVLNEQWDQFDGYVKKFEMPFFYVPGNHDMANPTEFTKWGERYGKNYYHFVYKNVLFLCLCSENPPDHVSAIDPGQQEWVKKTVAANAGVKWTFVFLHKPIWTAKDLDKNGWAAVEQALAGKKYTVFCGHVHRYQKFVRNGNNYYQLATTGGGSRLRGPEYGEFDQCVWITMKKDAPLLANVLLDGILPEDLKLPDTVEPGVKRKTAQTYPTSGTVTMDGQPVADAIVAFYRATEDKGSTRYAFVGDSLTDDVGRYKMTTYSRFDGAPAGEYVVTVVKTGKGYERGGGDSKSLLPGRYATPETSAIKVAIKEGVNELNFDLRSK
jgi:hypothetical protein